MLRASEPFCDFLSVSFPLGDAGAVPSIIDRVHDLVRPLGWTERGANVWEVGAYSGTMKLFERGGVCVLSFSGAVLRAVREGQLLQDLCMLVNGEKHRVTRLDASCDFLEDGPPAIAQLYRRVRYAGVQIGGKVVRDRDMTVYFSAAADGRRTGTLYLGGPRAEIRGCVYDKRHERLQKGFSDPGPLLRVEVRMRSQVGCSVFDALSPERVFYHYAAPDLCVPPAPVRSWGPYGAGFTVERCQSKYTAAQRLQWLIEDSDIVRQMLRLASQIGPHGEKFLIRQLRTRWGALGLRHSDLNSVDEALA